MCSFLLVLFGEDLFEPLRLSLGGGRVHEGRVMQDGKFFAAAIAAKSTHLLEVGPPIPRLPLLDRYCSHFS